MGLKLAQVGGMIRYEVRMQWRRGGLLAIMVLLAAALFLSGLWWWVEIRAMGAEGAASGVTISPERARQRATMAVTYLPWMYIIAPISVPWMLLLLTVPLIAAETIPQDRQAGVRELLNSLPLSPGVYLTGKLLGVWAGVVAGLAGIALLFGLLGWLLHGPYDLGEYLVLWAVGVTPLTLFTSGMSALLAAGQPTRRRATLVGSAFVMYCVTMLMTTSLTLWDAASLARPSLVHYLQRSYSLRIAPQAREWSHHIYPPGIVPLAIGLGALQMAMVWLIVWAWMRWKEGR